MKNVVKAIVVGGMTGATALLASGSAMAATGVYPPPPPQGTVTQVAPQTQVLGETVTKAEPAAVSPSATLPFTGLDTMALVSAGVVLIAGGSALTVASRKRRSGAQG
jgi:hypothetical protein